MSARPEEPDMPAHQIDGRCCTSADDFSRADGASTSGQWAVARGAFGVKPPKPRTFEFVINGQIYRATGRDSQAALLNVLQRRGVEVGEEMTVAVREVPENVRYDEFRAGP